METMQMNFLHSLAVALLLTILTEYAVYLLILRRDPLQLLLYSILINSFTNPLFNYLYNYQLHELYPLEMAVVLVESMLIVLLVEVSLPKALLISLTANLASLLVGLLIFG
jgi:branched-subunit amino acid ABC-type transport system permease component